MQTIQNFAGQIATILSRNTGEKWSLHSQTGFNDSYGIIYKGDVVPELNDPHTQILKIPTINIHYANGSNQTKLNVSGSFHGHPYNTYESVSINVSAKKNAGTIAREIENRLLPEYERHFAEVVEKWEINHKHLTDLRATADAIEEFANSKGQKIGDYSSERSPDKSKLLRSYTYDVRNNYSNGVGCTRADIYAPDRIQLKTATLNLEQTLQVLELISSFEKND